MRDVNQKCKLKVWKKDPFCGAMNDALQVTYSTLVKCSQNVQITD